MCTTDFEVFSLEATLYFAIYFTYTDFMKFFENIKKVSKCCFDAVRANPVVFVYSFLSFIFVALKIHDVEFQFIENWDVNKYHEIIGDSEDLCETLSYAFGTGCLTAVLLSIFARSFSSFKKYFIQGSAALGASVLICCIRFFAQDYDEIAVWGIIYALCFAIAFAFIPKQNSKVYFAALFKYFMFCVFMAGVLWLGLTILVWAFKSLILDFNDSDIYMSIGAFCYFVFAANAFVFYLNCNHDKKEPVFQISEKDGKPTNGKAFKVIILYILFPIFVVLLAVLYGYLVKALCLWKFPEGEINCFVSIAVTVCLVFYFILREFDDYQPVKLFYRFAPYAILPLICVQIISYIIRICAYGFTISRVSSLYFIIFSICTFTLILVKKAKYAEYSLLILAGFMLLGSITPLNIKRIALNNQYGRMLKVMKKYSMFDEQNQRLSDYDRKLLEDTMTNDDRKTLYDSYDYIRWSHLGKKKWWSSEDKFGDLFGLQRYHSDAYVKAFSSNNFTFDSYRTIIDISGYNSMNFFNKSDRVPVTWKRNEPDVYEYDRNHISSVKIAFTINMDEYEWDITDYILMQTEQQDELYVFMPDSNTKIFFTYISYAYDENRKLFRSYDVRGFMIRK